MIVCAFKALGATPIDDEQELKRLFESKRKTNSNDSSKIEAAYLDLLNPTKRVIHEITYYESSVFDDFLSLNFSSKSQTTVNTWELSRTVVNIGSWFAQIDGNVHELIGRINEARRISSFPIVDDVNIVLDEVNSFKDACVGGLKSYLGNLTKYSLVTLFNEIVKVPNFGSRMIDDLMSFYEAQINTELIAKENKCLGIASSLGRTCCRILDIKITLASNEEIMAAAINFDNYFRRINASIESLNKYELVSALKDYDYYAQPLQVNMQRHGLMHDLSAKLVNEVVQSFMSCTNMIQQKNTESETFLTQMKLIMMRDNSKVAMHAIRASLSKYLPRAYKVVDFLDSLTYDLIQIFIELDVLANLLRKLKGTLENQKNSISETMSSLIGITGNI